MNEWQIARPYAEGFYASAQKQGNAEQWLAFFSLMVDAIQVSDFHQMIIHPLVCLSDKMSVIRDMCKQSKLTWSDQVWQGFAMMVVHKRIAVLREVHVLLARLHQNDQGCIVGSVHFAHPMKASEKKKLSEWLTKRTNKKVQMIYQQDENLIGGFKLSFNDDVWDASLKGYLRKLSLDVEAITTTF